MRWWPVLVLLGCVSEKVTSVPESDTDTDADADADSDADVDVDTLITNFPLDCDSVTAIGPGPTESNHLAGVLLRPRIYPWQADVVKVALSNEEQKVLSCDAGKAHTVQVWRVDSTETRPPNDRDPDAELSFNAITVEDPVRVLVGALDPPIVLADGDSLAVAVQFGGFYPDSSCVTACNEGWEPDVDFWSNADARPYDWSLLGDFGIASNLWIFAEGAPVE